MKKTALLLSSLMVLNSLRAQTIEAYPAHWWAGMKRNKVQVLLRNAAPFASSSVKTFYAGVRIEKAQALENPHYLAIDLVIAKDAKPGEAEFVIGKTKLKWKLKARRTDKGYAQGVNSSDLLYLLMPDRFSNGDPDNDRAPGMRDQSLNRDSVYYRHGGDLAGGINHLDYLQSLGVTALWMTPVLENDMPERTEHGYAITNHYKVDPRLGGNEMYKKLSDELHKRGMKLVQDAVYNHVGLYHDLAQDKPTKDWLHEWPTYVNTNWRDQTLFDPYVAQADKIKLTRGWFSPSMPDLNQENPLQANFLIQHALWCVEEFGVDAWRIDTYIYNNLEFMNRCNQALLDEYPNMLMFGEAFVHSTLSQAFNARNNFAVGFKSNLNGILDFQSLFYGIIPFLNDSKNGLWKFYEVTAQDFIYKNPNCSVTFLDNHDMSRFFTVAGEDVRKQKMGLGWLLTHRGIPHLYYGTEVLMKGNASPRDGNVRLDFPGGWTGDKKNAFTETNLTQNELSAIRFVKKLGQYRKNSSALRTGKFMHYAPDGGKYVYFRYDEKQTVMIILNPSSNPAEIKLADYAERTQSFSAATDVMNDQTVGSIFTVAPMSIMIAELK